MIHKVMALDFSVRQCLVSGKYPPLLGLIDLEEEGDYTVALKNQIDGGSRILGQLCDAQPYAVAWAVARILRRHYSGESNHAIWPVLAEQLGVNLSVNSPARDGISKAFDRVFRLLGIPTEGFGRKVDLLLAQAGVAEGMLHHLATAFGIQERHFGPPSLDSSSELNTWEDNALQFMQEGVRTPRLAIEIDPTGWHATQYIRLRNGEAAADGFGEKFKTAIDESRQSSRVEGGKHGIVSPRLKWEDYTLALEVPVLEEALQLWPEGEDRGLYPAAGRPWIVPQPWPRSMKWKSGSRHNGRIRFLAGDRAIALFDTQSGRHLGEHGLSAGDGKNVSVDAVEAAIVARHMFAIDGEPCIRLNEGAFCAHVSLSAEGCLIGLGDLGIRLSLKPRPRITATCGVLAQGRSGKLVGPQGEIRLETGLGSQARRDVTFSSGQWKTVKKTDFDDRGVAHISVADAVERICRASGAALSDPFRLRIELSALDRNDENKGLSVARESFFVWPGVSIASDGYLFEAEIPPTNFSRERSIHVQVDSRGQVCLDRGGGYARAHMVFDIADAFAGFDVPFPDVTCVRRSQDARERFLALGSDIVVHDEQRFDSIIVNCADKDAALNIRGQRRDRAFAHSSLHHIPFRDLLEATGPANVTLVRPSGGMVDLFRVVEAEAPLHFKVGNWERGIQLSLEMHDRIDGIHVNLEDELGRHMLGEVAIGHRPLDAPPPPWLSASVPSDAPEQVVIRFDLDALPPGIHLCEIMVRPSGKDAWKRIGDRSGGVHALALEGPVRQEESSLNQGFETLNRWVSRCFAHNSWEQIKPIVLKRWRQLGTGLFELPSGHAAVLRVAAVEASDDAQRSWVPAAHPLSFLPELYGANACHFASLAESDEISAAALAVVAEVAGGRVQNSKGLDLPALLAFENSLQAHGNPEIRLKGFGMNKFLKNLPHRDFDNDSSAGDFWRGKPLLGPAHWRAAHLDLEKRTKAAGMFDSDEWRWINLRKLLGACHKFVDIKPPVPKRKDSTPESKHLDPQVASTLCSFAQAARNQQAVRWAASMARRLPDLSEQEVLRSVALLIRIAPQLFAFYMGLWQLAKR